MAKRSAVEQIVIEERIVCDAISKLISSKEKASAWHLKWAKFEEDEYLLFLFTKLSEMRWIWNESFRQFSEKHLEYLRTFKEIYHKERVIEETRKALQACEASTMKLKKQMESAQKKGDSVKQNSLGKEFESQKVMMEHLQRKIDNEMSTLLGFKIDQIQKGLKMEAQAGLQLADQMRHIFIAQRRIADLLPSCTPNDSTGSWQRITQSIIGLSDTLKMYPPPSGAVDPLPSPSESPFQGNKKNSNHESPVHSPQGTVPSYSSNTLPGRRSFPFTFRPLPQEPIDNHYQQQQQQQQYHHEYRSGSPTPPPVTAHPVSSKAAKFTRTSSDITPQSVSGSNTLPYKHKTSVTIFEENHSDPSLPRTRSASQPHNPFKKSSSSGGGIGIDLSPLRSHSQDLMSSSQEDAGHKSSRATSDIDITGGADSESCYADPVDALKKYHLNIELNNHNNDEHSDMTSLDTSYRSIKEVQKIRQVQLNKVQGSSYDEDPTYSRPFDCLIGLPNPVKVRAEPVSRRLVSPLTVQRRSTPEFPSMGAGAHTSRRRNHMTRKQKPKSVSTPKSLSRSTSSDDLSSSSSMSPSPEPTFTSMVSNHRQSSVSFDIEDDDDDHIILADDPYQILKSHSRNRSGDGILSMNSLDINSPSPLDSAQPSPVHDTTTSSLDRQSNLHHNHHNGYVYY